MATENTYGWQAGSMHPTVMLSCFEHADTSLQYEHKV